MYFRQDNFPILSTYDKSYKVNTRNTVTRRLQENDKQKQYVFLISVLLISAFSLARNYACPRPRRNLFTITLIVPGPNPSRKAWAAVVENSLDAAGIDAKRVELDWDTVYSRALTPDADTVGKTYDQGGFDALFVGYAMGIDPDPFALYDSSQFPPLRAEL